MINVSVGPNDDPLVLMWQRPESLPMHPEEAEDPGITVRFRRYAGPNRFRLVHNRADGQAIVDLPETSQNYHFAQPLPMTNYLCVAMRANDDQLNAGVHEADGALSRSFHVGDGVEDVQTTSSGAIWVSYFDEGIFGGPRGRTIGRDGANCFDQEGRVEFGFNPLARRIGLDTIANCDAMNVVSDDETWLWYYVEFPLVRVRDGWIDDYWPDIVDKALISGSHAFALVGERVLFRGGYRDRDRLYLVSLDGPRSQEFIPIDADGEPIGDFRAFGRGSCLYLWTARDLFVIDVTALPGWY